MTDLIIVDGEAWLPEEWDAERDKVRKNRRYQQSAKRRKQVKEAVARWRLKNPDKVKQYTANRRRRLVGSLHHLACTGPTRARGCVCRKVRVYDRPQDVDKFRG